MANGPHAPHAGPNVVARTVLKGRGLKNVSIMLAEMRASEDVMKVALQVALTGVDPDTHERVDWSVRERIMRMVLERELGAPAQHLQLQAHVKAQLAVQAVESTTRNPYATLTDEELAAAEYMGRKLGADTTRVLDEGESAELDRTAIPGESDEG